MDKKELIFKIEENLNITLVILKYFIKEPFYEFKKLLEGCYNSSIIFWFTLSLFIYMWYKKMFGFSFKIMGVIVFLIYFYKFIESGKWKKYYKKEMIEGKEDLTNP